MHGKSCFNFIEYKVPYIVIKNHRVFKVSQQLVEMTEYIEDDLLNKDIKEVFRILRIGPSVDIENIDEKADHFLFTKSFEFRLISMKIIKKIDKKIYIIKEQPNSRFEVKHPYLSQLCKSNLVGIAVYSVPDMILVKANQKYLDFLEPPFNQGHCSMGRKIDKIITEWKGSQVEKFWQKAICTGEVVQVKEYKHIGYGRGITYWDSIITPVSEDGKIKYVVSNTSEVTEKVINREKMQHQMEAISLQNKKMKAIFENISNGIFINYDDKIIIHQNESAKRLASKIEKLIVKSEKQKNIRYFDEYGKECRFEDIPAFRALKGEKIKNERITIMGSNDELILDISASPIYDKENNIIMSVTSVNDITQIVKNENTVKNNKENLKTIIDNISEGLVLIDKEANLTILNKVAEKHFNFIEMIKERNNNIYGVKYFDSNGKEIYANNLPLNRIAKGETVTEYRLTIKTNNDEIYVCINGNPVYDDEGRFLFGIMCMRDITEKVKQEKIIKLQQNAVLQAERERNEALEKTIAMKDEFLSIISHEFRTPLNVINSAIQAMECICANELSIRSKKYLDMIRLNTFRQVRLVNNLLDITRSNLGNVKINKKNIDMVMFTREIINSVREYAVQRGSELIFKASNEEIVIAIDMEKYERILLNILSNAIKFTLNNEPIIINVCVSKDNIFIEIKDSGIGIPSDKINVIFERFGQVDSSLSRQAEGTGIGLSLVKKFVQELGGSISVKSEVGKGSTFTVKLPNEKFDLKDDSDESKLDFSDNHLVQAAKLEFSDIYF